MTDAKRLIILALGLLIVLSIGFAIRTAIVNHFYDQAKTYNTAVQATEPDRLNYVIDSRQGNLLGRGNFTTPTPVRFDEMNQSYLAVWKIREEYTQHTETYSCGPKGEDTCTRTYYTWDYAGEENKLPATVRLHGREYPATLFSYRAFRHGIDVCAVVTTNCRWGYQYENGWFGGDTRYYYEVVDTSITASFLGDVRSGTLKPNYGSTIKLENKDIAQLLADVNNYELGANVFIWIWCIVFTLGAGWLGFHWAEETIE